MRWSSFVRLSCVCGLLLSGSGCHLKALCGDEAKVTSPELGVFTSLAGNTMSACAMTSEGRVYCWGLSYQGGQRSRERGMPEGRFVQVESDGGFGCGIDDQRHVACWGPLVEGPHRQRMPEGEFRQVSLSPHFACAIRDEGEVWCWSHDVRPKVVGTLSDAVFVATHEQGLGIEMSALEMCWIDSAGKGWCNDWASKRPALALAGGASLRALVMGSVVYCGVGVDGSLACFHHDDHSPVELEAAPDEAVISVDVEGLEIGRAWQICAVTQSGALRCWTGKKHEVGARLSEADSCAPGSTEYRAVTLGFGHTCGLRADGRVACWGMGQACQVP